MSSNVKETLNVTVRSAHSITYNVSVIGAGIMTQLDPQKWQVTLQAGLLPHCEH